MSLAEIQPGCGKIKYQNQRDATRAAQSLFARAGKGKPSAYHCAVCGSFHIGRKGQKQKPREDNTMLLDKFRGNTASVQNNVANEMMANRELSWLAQRVARGQKEPFSEIATITPSIAKHILERNDDNRRITQSLVDQIATDIADGLWQLNGESIVISRDGILNDGQHRLNAIIKSGIPVRSVVMFGVSRESRTTVDMGAARKAGDLLTMNHVSNTTVAAGCARLLIMYHKGQFSTGKNGNPAPTKQQIVAYYHKTAKVIDRASAVASNNTFFKKSSGTAWAAAHAILMQKNKDAAELFFHKAASGESLKRGDAILTLRLHCMEAKGEFRKTSEWLEMILLYWNAWRDGRTVSRKLSLKKKFPAIEG